jgi:hypothetical protein
MGRPPIGKTAMTAAERQRQRRERLRQAGQPAKPRPQSFRDSHHVTKQDAAALQARIAQLEAELARARRAPAPVSKRHPLDDDLITRLQAQVRRLEAAHRAAAKAEPIAPPVEHGGDAGAEIDVLRATLARRDATIRELRAEIRHVRKEIDTHDRGAAADLKAQIRRITMSRAIYSKVINCLHPDQRDNATEADKNEACGLFTEWKRKQDKP